MQVAGGPEGLIQRAEHKRERDVEGPVKPADGVGQCAGVLGDRRRDPRVGELEQERTASAKKNRRLSIRPPGQRAWTKYPFDLSRRQGLNCSKLKFEILAADYIALHPAADLRIFVQLRNRATRRFMRRQMLRLGPRNPNGAEGLSGDLVDPHTYAYMLNSIIRDVAPASAELLARPRKI